MSEITMRQLLKAGVHFGHQTRYWSPSMSPYIFGHRNKIHIINLDKTLPMLKEAMNYIGSITAQSGKVLFVGTKRQAGKIVKEHGIRCGTPYVDHRWLGGMLTNFQTVKNSITRLKELEQRINSNAVAKLSKKEGLSLERERAKLDRTLAGIKDMNTLPDALFVIDVEHEYIAVAEANKLGIPVIAVVDSNCSIKGVDYVIPGNDDSSRAISLYLQAAADTIIESRTTIQNVEVATGDDEYIEIDDSNQVVTNRKGKENAKVVVRKSASKHRTEPASADEESVAATDAVARTAEEKPAVKKVIKKKVVKKKLVKKKVLKKAAQDTATEVVVTKKTAAKKTTAKKTTAKKTVTKKQVVKKTTSKTA